MKKLFFSIMLALSVTMTSLAGSIQIPVKSRISSIVSEYSKTDGVNYIKIGSLATMALKTMVKAETIGQNDEETKAVKKILKGLSSITVLDYSDCRSAVRDDLQRKIDKSIASYDILMEMKDSGGRASIYALVNEKSSKIEDLVIYTPSDNAVICLNGSFDISVLGSLLTK